MKTSENTKNTENTRENIKNTENTREKENTKDGTPTPKKTDESYDMSPQVPSTTITLNEKDEIADSGKTSENTRNTENTREKGNTDGRTTTQVRHDEDYDVSSQAPNTTITLDEIDEIIEHENTVENTENIREVRNTSMRTTTKKLNYENDEMSPLDPNKHIDDKSALKHAASPGKEVENKKSPETKKIEVKKQENININIRKTETRNMKTSIRKKTKDQEVSQTPKENIRKWLTHQTPSENNAKCFEIGPRQSRLKEKPRFKKKKK